MTNFFNNTLNVSSSLGVIEIPKFSRSQSVHFMGSKDTFLFSFPLIYEG